MQFDYKALFIWKKIETRKNFQLGHLGITSRNFSAELRERMKPFGTSGVSPAPSEYQSMALPKYKAVHLMVWLMCDLIWCLIYQ